MDKKEKELLVLVTNHQDGLLSPASLFNSIGKGNSKKEINKLIVEGYIEEVPRTIPSGKLITFYRASSKGRDYFLPVYKKIFKKINVDKKIPWQGTIVGIIILGLFTNWLYGVFFSEKDYKNITGNENTVINGNNNLIDNKTLNLLNTENNEKIYKEYVYVNNLFYVQALTDKNNKVLVYSVTTRKKDFNPIFNTPDNSIRIILGKTKFSEISDGPEKKYGWVGAHTFSYIEKYYLGNPGNYADYYFSINDAGYTEFGEFDQLTLLNPEFIDLPENFEKIKKFRGSSVINTYSVTQPVIDLAIESGLVNNLGPSVDQVRVMEENNEKITINNKEKWLGILQKLYADVDIEYFNELLGKAVFINDVKLQKQ